MMAPTKVLHSINLLLNLKQKELNPTKIRKKQTHARLIVVSNKSSGVIRVNTVAISCFKGSVTVYRRLGNSCATLSPFLSSFYRKKITFMLVACINKDNILNI